MNAFAPILKRAVARKGKAELDAAMPEFKSPAQLARLKDDRVLAEMTKCVFRSGFVWQVVENKWPDFEAAFARFDVNHCRMLSDEDLEQLVRSPKVIRNAICIWTTARCRGAKRVALSARVARYNKRAATSCEHDDQIPPKNRERFFYCHMES